MKSDPFSDLHWHYKVQAAAKKAWKDPKDKNNWYLSDSAIIDVVADSDKEAIAKAKKMLKKKIYRIGEVYEHHSSSTGYELGQEIQITQLKIQKEMLDLFKGMQ